MQEKQISLTLSGESLRQFNFCFKMSGAKSQSEFLRALIRQDYKSMVPAINWDIFEEE